MDLLLLVAKYGVITAAFLVVASSASKELSLLFARIRKQSKFVQLCVFAFIMTAVVYGGSKPSTNSVTTSTHTLPQWYIEHGYPSTDTDGDGIPDAWERWTHTKPLSNDALVDYDGDGVDNITEFMYMCDPIRSDTDGDGLDDMIEIDGLLADIESLNPVVRATFDISEPDLDGDGITDLWDEVAHYNSYNLFSDDDGNGFDDVYANNMPAASQNNFDVAVTITTTRTALLSSEFGNMLIAPCTNKVVKLRLSDSEEEGSVSLSAVPDGVSISGLWKARMDIAFLPRMGQATEKNRIKVRDGFYVDFENMTIDYVGYISPINRRGINSNSNGKVLVCYVPKFLKLYSNSESICLLHGPNHDITLDVCEELLPVSVSIGDITYEMTEPTIDLLDIFNTATLMCEALTFRISKDDEPYQEVGIEQDFHLKLKQLCYPSTTNITGVAEYRSLNYLDVASHEPRIETEIVTFGSNCPVATNINAVIGFSHDKVNTRNLPIIYTSDSRDSNTDHCVGVKYKSTLEINLLDYVDNKFDKFTNIIYFKCNGIKVNGNIISNIEHPREFNPTFLYIELCYNEPAISLDSLWLTIYSPDDFDKYHNWIIEELNRGTNWLNTLPAVYEEMIDIGNLNANWNKTTPINPNSYMHHHATYESRSYPVEGKHGHQATYDSNGNLIRDGIAAGSADFFSPKGAFDEETELHRNIDVYPFIRAAQQDGNPVRPSNATDLLINIIPTRFSRPCIYQGQNLETYFKYRPALPSGTIPHTGENQ